MSSASDPSGSTPPDSPGSPGRSVARDDESSLPPAERVRYGPGPSQFGELHRPVRASRGVVVVIHGGFWRSEYDLTLGTPLARSLAAHGWTAWNLEYRRVGSGSGGGGGAAAALLGHRPTEADERYDPAQQLPLDVPLWCVHGTDDTIVPLSQSTDYAAAARADGARAEVVEVAGDHFVVIDPASAAWTRTLEILDGIDAETPGGPGGDCDCATGGAGG